MSSRASMVAIVERAYHDIGAEEPVIYRTKTLGPYNRTTGAQAETPVDLPDVPAIFVAYDVAKLPSGVQPEDSMAVILASAIAPTRPTNGDQLVRAGYATPYTVVAFTPDPLDATFTLQLRRPK